MPRSKPPAPTPGTRDYYLTAPYGRAHWLAWRYHLPFEDVLADFHVQEIGVAEVLPRVLEGYMLRDWPPPPDSVIADGRYACEQWLFENNPEVAALQPTPQPARAKYCSFCQRKPSEVGYFYEESGNVGFGGSVRICSTCAEIAAIAIQQKRRRMAK